MTLLGVPAARADLRYRIVRLDPHHCVECASPASRAYDINDLFNVVGWAEIRPEGENDEVRRAFIWSPDGIGSVVPAEDVHPVPHPEDATEYDPFATSEARAINVHDQVAGWGMRLISSNYRDRAFLWLPTTAFSLPADFMNNLGTTGTGMFAQSQAHALTDRQDPLRVVGVSFDSSAGPACGLGDPSVWTSSGPSAMTSLGLPPKASTMDDWAEAAALGTRPMNDTNTTVLHVGHAGGCLDDLACNRDDVQDAAVRWSASGIELDHSVVGGPGRMGVAYDATDDGYIVGAVGGQDTPDDAWSECVLHAAFWEDGSQTPEFLPMPDPTWQQDESVAYAIAGDGAGGYRIVGARTTPPARALLWEGEPGSWTVSVLEDLTSIVTATTCGFDDLEAAWGVNEFGWIVGWGTSSTTDQDQAFVLIPIEDDCPADVTGDGVVDFDDTLAVLVSWGATCPAHEVACPIPDANYDCLVGFQDIIAINAAWGDCPGESALAGAPELSMIWLLAGGLDALMSGAIDGEDYAACFESSDSAIGVFAALCELLDSSEEE